MTSTSEDSGAYAQADELDLTSQQPTARAHARTRLGGYLVKDDLQDNGDRSVDALPERRP